MERYVEIVKYFLKLGFIAFGGPAAHISMMENDLVKEKKWMTRQEFLDYIGITNLIPGPNSTEVTMHCGYHRGGLVGLILAGFSFITPAVLLTGLLAYIFFRYNDLAIIEQVARGFKIVVLIIIADATHRLFKKAARNNYLIILAIVSATIYWFYSNEIVLLISVILFSYLKFNYQNRLNSSLIPWFFFFTGSAEETIGVLKIFLSFLKVGCILFGSGYVLFAYLDTIFIQELQVLTVQELLDAIAIGQFTPGPILSTSTFIGYNLGGWQGAIAATVGIFMPSFIFVMVTSPLVARIRKSPLLSEMLDTVNAVSLSFIAVVSIKLIIQTVDSWQSFLVLVVCVFLFFKFRINTVYLLVIGAISFLLLTALFS